MITELKIKNFRSLKDVELKYLQPVNLLIGPNNSGKSNILKALKFFGEFIEGKMPTEEQLSLLFFHSPKDKNQSERKSLAFQFLSENSEENIPLGFGEIHIGDQFSNSIPIFNVSIGRTEITPKELPFNSLPNRDVFDELLEEFESYDFGYGTISQHIDGSVFEDAMKSLGPYIGSSYKKHHTRTSAIDKEFFTTIPDPHYGFMETNIQKQVLDSFPNIKIYGSVPSKLLELYPIQNEQVVNEDASNLVAFLDTMNRSNPRILKRIIENLNRFVPEFEFFISQVEDNPQKEFLQKYPHRSFARVGLSDIYGRNFWADSLSEGTLYFLSLLCIIHQPEPPKLLLLEEPEKGIHPRKIRETMRLIFELAEEKNIQVILTTHSTDVVDTFADIPEAVYIVEREGLETKVKNLQRDVIEPHNEQFIAAGEDPIRFTDALGEHWAMGFLGGVPNDND